MQELEIVVPAVRILFKSPCAAAGSQQEPSDPATPSWRPPPGPPTSTPPSCTSSYSASPYSIASHLEAALRTVLLQLLAFLDCMDSTPAQ